MIPKITWSGWKIWTTAVIALVLALDLGLAGYLWHASLQQPQTLRAERDNLIRQAKLLREDVDRGEKIRASLPQTGKDCDAFYHDAFLDASSGYSRIESDLGAIAADSGVKISGYTFNQKEVKDRGVTEIQISTSVDADYPSVIRFINGLERSKNFYLLDKLQLASASTGGGIRLDLSLHTYFRT
jgi:Type II secretion system (T2SS), protein M subtype b